MRQERRFELVVLTVMRHIQGFRLECASRAREGSRVLNEQDLWCWLLLHSRFLYRIVDALRLVPALTALGIVRPESAEERESRERSGITHQAFIGGYQAGWDGLPENTPHVAGTPAWHSWRAGYGTGARMGARRVLGASTGP